MTTMAKTKTEYCVVACSVLYSNKLDGVEYVGVIDEVNEKLADGWVVCGNLVFGVYDGEEWFYQPMLRQRNE
jgi:hypothetical protein